MDDFKTVEGVVENTSVDPLIAKQKQDVAAMRASLLCCSTSSTVASAVTSIKNITVLRVFHQISRIIRYLEMMDKIEAKLYESIDYTLEHSSSSSPSTMMMLLGIQERLQKNLIDSHKLIQPYLNVQELGLDKIVYSSSAPDEPDAILDKGSRDKLRSAAQKALEALEEEA